MRVAGGLAMVIVLAWTLKGILLLGIGGGVVWWLLGPAAGAVAFLFAVAGYLTGNWSALSYMRYRGVRLLDEKDAFGRPRIVFDPLVGDDGEVWEADEDIEFEPGVADVEGAADVEATFAMLKAAREGVKAGLAGAGNSSIASGVMEPFGLRYPEIAERETRVATIFDDRPHLPAGRYLFMDSYCVDPDCDCRRVRITVVNDRRPNEVQATISYGWASAEYYQNWLGGKPSAIPMHGVHLEPIAPQSRSAPALVTLFEQVLGDGRYAARLQRHYRMMKRPVKRSGRPTERRKKRR